MDTDNKQLPAGTLMAHKDGTLVEIAHTSTLETIHFRPQGGGFDHSLPREEFFDLYSPAELPPFKLVRVSADWLEVSISAYFNEMYWNGSVQPHFTKESADELVAAMPELRYDEAADAYVFEPPADSGTHYDDEDSGKLVFSAEVIDTVDGPKKVYPIGAGYWMWFLDEGDED